MKHGAGSKLAVALLAVLALGGCSGDSSLSVAATSVPRVESVIIDVRTPEEYRVGHLDGALLIDIKDASFDAKIAELDPDADYVVYCRSGNRSAQAVLRMREIGIRNITDLGSLENASAETGIAIIEG
jgi:phage shock protein E